VKLAPVKPPGVPLLHYILQLVHNGANEPMGPHLAPSYRFLLIDDAWFAAPDTSPLVSRGLSLIARGAEQRHRLHFAGSFREQQRRHPIYARCVVGIRCE
jgi:hypothetical protein